jgi:hypothetical protein
MEQACLANPDNAQASIVEIINGCRVTLNFREQPNPDVKDIVLGMLLDSFAERIRNGGGCAGCNGSFDKPNIAAESRHTID